MTGFRGKSQPLRAFGAMGKLSAGQFAPDVKQLLKRALTTAIQTTPARNLNTIRSAQVRQYRNRVNYIPSFHTLEDPTLIVKDDDTQWLYRSGKWYRPDIWTLPDEVWNDYETLNRERERRLQTSESQFIEDRGQARFLYRKTWWEIGQSAGVSVSCTAPAQGAVTRRRNPPLNPPKGYAQMRGGKAVYSIVVRNPFLEQTSQGGHTPLATARYKPFAASQIMDKAIAVHRPRYEKDVANRAEDIILQILRFLLK